MTYVKPLGETEDTVTLSRADFDTLIEEAEDAEDRLTVLQDCLADLKPEQARYLLTLAETMRVIGGENPITVWREKRGLMLAQLADAVGLHDADLAEIEAGGSVSSSMLWKLAGVLEASVDQLRPVIAAS